ncbi:MAG: RidA family protein [Bacteroidetes bacterium]|nr:RidA family protein [Bacteroidota bacterium]
MKSISTPSAPTPAGHYSQAIEHNGLIFISGQLSVDPATGEIRNGSIEDQTRLVLENLSGILKAAGSDMNHVLKVTIYVSDIDLWGAVNHVYAKTFGEHRPARAVVPSRDLHHGCLIEMEAIATVI